MNILNNIFIYILIVVITIFILYKKKYNFNLDDYFASIFINNIYLLKYIHPNIITISGLLLNFYIYKLLNTNKINIYILFLSLFYRWLADILDGAIARKYNKQSKLGHYLDTLSDSILIIIGLHFILISILNFSFYISSIFIILILMFLFIRYNILESHKNLKKYNKHNLIDYTIQLFTNNSYIYFTILFLLYLFTYIN